ncbi:MAG: sensor histidine kinase [Janthinobacterium lividum]
MKLSTKFSLFSTLSRVAIVLLLLGVLPGVMSRLALLATDQRLARKRDQVLRLVYRQGVSAFFIAQGQHSAGSYNLLKEEFIFFKEIPPGAPINLIEDSKRAVDDKLVDYRVLSYSFVVQGRYCLLEIGRSVSSIGETERNFRYYAFYILVGGVGLTMLADLAFFRYLVRPLRVIIRRRLRDVRHPAAFNFDPIRTNTDDFRYLDQSLRAMMTTLQRSFEKERRFIADASHELLTPLATLNYRLDNMLGDDSLSEENQLRVVDSQRTVYRLRVIIKSLLLISKIENDQFVRADTVSVAALVAEVTEEAEDRLAVLELRLHQDVTPDYQFGPANRSLLFTLLFNLVNNAIKYNRPGGEVLVRGGYCPAPDGRYELEVRDTGLGIAAAQLPTLFKRFNKGTAADAESYGLGLSIVKTIAELHGLTIEVSSTEGRGTSFRILFPPEN